LTSHDVVVCEAILDDLLQGRDNRPRPSVVVDSSKRKEFEGFFKKKPLFWTDLQPQSRRVLQLVVYC